MHRAVSNKKKGKDFEREIVKLIREWGLKGERTYGSTGVSVGLQPDVDIILTLDNGNRMFFQCERVKKLRAKYRTPEHLDGVIFREDKMKPVIMVDLDFFLGMTKILSALDVKAGEIIQKRKEE